MEVVQFANDADADYRCDDMVKSFNVSYVPGGATQNTIRIAQVFNYLLGMTVILVIHRQLIITGMTGAIASGR